VSIAKVVSKSKYGDLSQRLWFLAGCVGLYIALVRIYTRPGIDPVVLADLVSVAERMVFWACSTCSRVVHYPALLFSPWAFMRNISACYHHAAGGNCGTAAEQLKKEVKPVVARYAVHPLRYVGIGSI